MGRVGRRQFLIVTSAILAAPLARAQPAGKVHRVALVLLSAPVSDMAGLDPIHPLPRAFFHELRDLGYVEGRNLVLERRPLDGKVERAGEVVAEVLRFKPDVIVSASNQITRAAKDATTSVPIVMAGNVAPVESALVRSLAHPGGNVTGLSYGDGPVVEGKRLSLLKEAVPGISRVAFVGSDYLWEVAATKHVRTMTQTLGLQLFHAAFKGHDVAPALATVPKEHAEAMFVATEVSTYHKRHRIIEFAAETRRSASYGHQEAVEDGGLMSYSMKATDVYRRAAGKRQRCGRTSKDCQLPLRTANR